MGLHRFFDAGELFHQRLVDMQTTGGIQKDHVVAVLRRVGDSSLGDLDGVRLPHLEDWQAQLFADDLQLLNGSGPVDIAGDEQRAFTLLFHEPGQLCAVRRFTGALQADQHDDGRRLGGDGQLLILAAHQIRQLFVDDLDDHLRRGQAFQHIAADAALRRLFDKVFDDFIADVRFQKGQANFPHGFLHIGFCQAALAPELFKGCRELFC